MILETLLTGRTIAFNVKFVWITGSVNAALLLSQLCYWSDKSETPNLFYKTINEIEDEIGLSRHEQDGAIKILLQKSFIFLDKRGVPPKRYFSVQWKIIEHALLTIENKASVQIAENRQINLRKQNAKNVKKSCRKTANQTAENWQIKLPKIGKFLIDDKLEENRELEREENQNFSSEQIELFISSLLVSEKVRSPLAYAHTIRDKISIGHKPTLSALSDFLSRQEIQARKNELVSLSNRLSSLRFQHDGEEFIFRICGFCASDGISFEGMTSDSVYIAAWFVSDSSRQKVFTFDNLSALQAYIEGVFNVQ